MSITHFGAVYLRFLRAYPLPSLFLLMFLNVLDSAVFKSFLGFLQDTIYKYTVDLRRDYIRNRQVTLNEQVSSMTMRNVTKL